jgi:hypothetical protein
MWLMMSLPRFASAHLFISKRHLDLTTSRKFPTIVLIAGQISIKHFEGILAGIIAGIFTENFAKVSKG